MSAHKKREWKERKGNFNEAFETVQVQRMELHKEIMLSE